MSPRILIIGATGVIGKPITAEILAAKSSFDRVAVLTSSNTIKTKTDEVKALKEQGVDVLEGDLTVESDVKRAYEGIDTVVSCVGRGAILTQLDLIKWASETPSVTHFFPSEFGTDIEHNAASPNEKPHQLKLQVRKYAKTVPKDKLHFTYLVTGPYSDGFFGNSGKDEMGTFDVKAKRAVLLATGNEKVALIAMADVGKLVVACIQQPLESQDKILIVNSFTATPNEILAEFEKQTGAKWTVSYVSLEDLKKFETQAWESGAPYATAMTLRRIWTEGGTLYNKPRDNGLVGDPEMETLADQVRQAIEKQTK
ncbi:Isoflavone reductase [Hyphodiscus hymeniophilus]|uniref:Isoflavone reductase n=1 Tax=Hyphodiscus hymeniophilus TaxID=353542 RepID=A0A9P7AU30_9HELO|nr:Isoflavone reductase [Hyphodiscus hymeniophilus]